MLDLQNRTRQFGSLSHQKIYHMVHFKGYFHAITFETTHIANLVFSELNNTIPNMGFTRFQRFLLRTKNKGSIQRFRETKKLIKPRSINSHVVSRRIVDKF